MNHDDYIQAIPAELKLIESGKVDEVFRRSLQGLISTEKDSQLQHAYDLVAQVACVYTDIASILHYIDIKVQVSQTDENVEISRAKLLLCVGNTSVLRGKAHLLCELHPHINGNVLTDPYFAPCYKALDVYCKLLNGHLTNDELLEARITYSKRKPVTPIEEFLIAQISLL